MRAFPVCGIRCLCMSEMPVVGAASNYGTFFLCPQCHGDTLGRQHLKW